METNWYDLDTNEAHKKLWAEFQNLEKDQEPIRQRERENLRQYGTTASGKLLARLTRYGYLPRLEWNVTASCVNTLVSKIGKLKPYPRLIPSNASYTYKERCKFLNQYVLSQMNYHKVWDTGRRVVQDALIFGTGVLKMVNDDDGMVVERVLPSEIYVYDLDGMYGKPGILIQRKPVSKRWLLANYPEKEHAINKANSSELHKFSLARVEDVVDLLEVWRLPEGDQPGRHIICLEDETFLDEEWTRPNFPFIFLRWINRPIGFWGLGVCEQVEGIQIEINSLLYNIQKAIKFFGKPWLLVERSAEVPSDHLQNRMGAIIRFNRHAPQVVAHKPIHEEVIRLLNEHVTRAYHLVGISELTAGSKKPGGLVSGKALIEYHDIETERFAQFALDLETFYMEVAEHFIALAKERAKEDEGYEVTIKGKDFFKKIKWNEVDMEEDKYMIEKFPTSLLPHTPAGKLDIVQHYMQAGFVDKDQAMELLDIPDLERFQSLEFASRDIAKKTIENILENGEYLSPEPFDNLQFCHRHAINTYNLARLEGNYPEEHLELLRQYILEAEQLITVAQNAQEAEAAKMQAPQGQGAPAMPGPQPAMPPQ